MRILTFSRVGLGEARAHGINIVNTAAALARAGATVTVHADTNGADRDSILKDHGITASPRLTFRDMGWRWHNLALPLVAPGLLRATPGEPSILFVNEVRPFALTLIRAARKKGLKVAFEAHNAAGMMMAEKAGVPVPDAASAGSGLNLMGGYKLAEESEEERAGRERATPKPDPEAMERAEKRAALEREILLAADVLLAPQRLTIAALKGMTRPGVPAFAVPNATLIPPPAPPKPKEFDIIYCGSLDDWKGVDDVVAAMPKLYPYKLTLVGAKEGPDVARLKEIALKLGVVSRVEFRGKVPSAQVWDLYARARVGIVPLHPAFVEAREYTSPVKLFEMMAAGLPIVAARLASIQEYVTEGQEVLMAKSDSPDEYAASIRKLLEDADLAQKLAASGRAKAAEFTYDRRAAKFLGAFQAALG
ncbi:MAG: glycosyltransferase family 4 protein [Acidobacteria bacterium]|nr:glycosyltransferase family 4 protein [Acidobacteriota bacterium]